MTINPIKTLLKGIFLLTVICVYDTSSAFAAQPTYTMQTLAKVAYPNAMDIDRLGNVYVGSNEGVRMYNKALGTNALITGSGPNVVACAMAVAVVPNSLTPAAANAVYTIYTADQNNRIYKLVYNAQTRTYIQTVIATNEAAAAAGVIYDPAVKYSAGFGGGKVRAIGAIAVDARQNIFIADKESHVIWKLTPKTNGAYTLSVVAGTLGIPGVPAVTGTKFRNPMGLRFNGMNNLFVTDNGNKVIQKLTFKSNGDLDKAAVVVGVVGNSSGFQDSGSPLTGCLSDPKGLAFDTSAATGLYISDGNVVKYVSFNSNASQSKIKLFAGTFNSAIAKNADYSGVPTGTAP